MLTEVDIGERVRIESECAEFIQELKHVESLYPFRATRKEQYPEGVEVPKKEVAEYRGKMETLLKEMKKVSPFDIDDPAAQNEAYISFRKIVYWYEHDRKFPWRTSLTSTALHGSQGEGGLF
jgi:hypothetical protein